MTKLPTQLATNLSRQPANVTDMTPEDRVTHRKWAYGWLMAYAVLLGALMTFSVATRPEPRTREASRTIGIERALNSTASIPVSGRAEHHR